MCDLEVREQAAVREGAEAGINTARIPLQLLLFQVALCCLHYSNSWLMSSWLMRTEHA